MDRNTPIVEIPDDQQLPGKPHGCQEAVVAFEGQTKPFSCGKPATTILGWPVKGEGPYRMCNEHASHSCNNRGATYLGAYEPEHPDVT
jgi:hypothetical protein